MLASVVNTLKQRGEWLNGGRGAAKHMIDRPSANQVTPFGAAEHLEFWSRWCSWGLCEWLLAGRDGRKPARMKGLQSGTCCLLISVLSWSGTEAVRLTWTHCPEAPAAGNMPPCKAMHPHWPVWKPGRTSAAPCKEISPWTQFVFESNMAPPPLQHIFCLSVGFPKFVSGKSLVVRARRLQGAHRARLMNVAAQRRRFQWLCCCTKARESVRKHHRIDFFTCHLRANTAHIL